MLTHARYAYNENSTLLVQHIMLAQFGLVVIAAIIHGMAWTLGAATGLFETPAMLTTLHPFMCAMLLPGIGWALGLIVSWFLGNASDDDPYWSAGNTLGQLACFGALLTSLPG